VDNGRVSRGGTALVALLAVAVLPTPAEAALPFRNCNEGIQCARMTVPLDRSGAGGGRISLYVERRRAFRRPRAGVAVLLSGGPGQPSTDSFDGLFPDDAYAEYAGLVPRHDVVAFDPRGTGRSGLLRCPELERASLIDAGREAARCAERLGARRGFYRTNDTVDDLEALRAELGAERLTLIGVSYGTLVAQQYAARYPDRVERLMLDSVLAEWDPLYRDIFEAVPRVLGAVCGRGCRRFTDDPVADVARLVERLGRGRLRGRVTLPDGRRRRGSLTREELFFTLVSGDLDEVSRSAFPAAVTSALRGDAAPILRLKRRAVASEGSGTPRTFSSALYAATTCEEIPFPWARFSDPAARPEQVLAVAEALPPEAYHPFDAATAAGNDFIRMCRRWPEASPAPLEPPPPGSLPDVPVLMLEGEEDLRTPVEGARRAAAAWPDAHVLTVPGIGHSVFGSDVTGCLGRATRRFFAGRRVRSRCGRAPDFVGLPDPLPASLGQVAPGGRGRVGRVARATQLTIVDVYDDFGSAFLSGRPAERGGGLRGGRWISPFDGPLRLERVQVVPGVRVSGSIDLRNRGVFRVDGPGGIDGVLRLRGAELAGRLAGRPVRVGGLFAETTARGATPRPRPALRVP